MDLNYLLHREQVELVRAVSAGCDEARLAHFKLAELYRERIEAYRGRAGSAARGGGAFLARPFVSSPPFAR